MRYGQDHAKIAVKTALSGTEETEMAKLGERTLEQIKNYIVGGSTFLVRLPSGGIIARYESEAAVFLITRHGIREMHQQGSNLCWFLDGLDEEGVPTCGNGDICLADIDETLSSLYPQAEHPDEKKQRKQRIEILVDEVETPRGTIRTFLPLPPQVYDGEPMS